MIDAAITNKDDYTSKEDSSTILLRSTTESTVSQQQQQQQRDQQQQQQDQEQQQNQDYDNHNHDHVRRRRRLQQQLQQQVFYYPQDEYYYYYYDPDQDQDQNQNQNQNQKMNHFPRGNNKNGHRYLAPLELSTEAITDVTATPRGGKKDSKKNPTSTYAPTGAMTGETTGTYAPTTATTKKSKKASSSSGSGSDSDNGGGTEDGGTDNGGDNGNGDSGNGGTPPNAYTGIFIDWIDVSQVCFSYGHCAPTTSSSNFMSSNSNSNKYCMGGLKAIQQYQVWALGRVDVDFNIAWTMNEGASPCAKWDTSSKTLTGNGIIPILSSNSFACFDNVYFIPDGPTLNPMIFEGTIHVTVYDDTTNERMIHSATIHSSSSQVCEVWNRNGKYGNSVQVQVSASISGYLVFLSFPINTNTLDIPNSSSGDHAIPQLIMIPLEIMNQNADYYYDIMNAI